MIKLEINNKRRVYCRVYIKAYNSGVMRYIDFKVDTGADLSTISKNALYALGYSNEWINNNKITLGGEASTASGDKFRSVYIPLNINIYGLEGIDIPFGILLDDNITPPKPSCIDCEYVGVKKRDYNLLLGNNILSYFDINTDRDNNLMILKYRENYKPLEKIFPNQKLQSLETVDGMLVGI